MRALLREGFLAALCSALAFGAGRACAARPAARPGTQEADSECLRDVERLAERLQSLQDRQATLVLQLDRQDQRGHRR
jgi:hypothetical protein